MSLVRYIVGFIVLAVLAGAHMVVLLLLLPSYALRVRASNCLGHVLGPAELAITGCDVSVEGREAFDGSRPAIYASNHTSMLDIFIAIWLSPRGTVGVGKAEVIWIPIFGQAYALSGNLRIDRGNRERAKASLKKLGERVRKHKLSIFYWPEGTRMKDGRLGTFKKGLYHLAVATGLPIVPVVVTNAHKAMPKNTRTIVPTKVGVRTLPPVDTSGWADMDPAEAMAALQQVFADALPEEQKPLPG